MAVEMLLRCPRTQVEPLADRGHDGLVDAAEVVEDQRLVEVAVSGDGAGARADEPRPSPRQRL